MTNPIVNDVKSSAKTLAQQIAKQMAREPLEILKDARQQFANESGRSEREDFFAKQQKEAAEKQREHEEMLVKDKIRSGRFIEALNRELADIRKQKLFSELQAKIANGEDVPIEEYAELTMDQKQVLNAQKEAVKIRMQNQSKSYTNVPSVHSKPSRRFGAGQKQAAQKEQTHVEKPVPPSG